MSRRRKLPGPRNTWVVVEHDDGSGAVGPRGSRPPNWVRHSRGKACVSLRSSQEPLGVGGEARPEQVLDVRGYRPDTTARLRAGMRLVWDEREWDIYSVDPVFRGATGEVDILATDKNTAGVVA